jgi:hypothetical protein
MARTRAKSGSGSENVSEPSSGVENPVSIADTHRNKPSPAQSRRSEKTTAKPTDAADTNFEDLDGYGDDGPVSGLGAALSGKRVISKGLHDRKGQMLKAGNGRLPKEPDNLFGKSLDDYLAKYRQANGESFPDPRTMPFMRVRPETFWLDAWYLSLLGRNIGKNEVHEAVEYAAELKPMIEAIQIRSQYEYVVNEPTGRKITTQDILAYYIADVFQVEKPEPSEIANLLKSYTRLRGLEKTVSVYELMDWLDRFNQKNEPEVPADNPVVYLLGVMNQLVRPDQISMEDMTNESETLEKKRQDTTLGVYYVLADPTLPDSLKSGYKALMGVQEPEQGDKARRRKSGDRDGFPKIQTELSPQQVSRHEYYYGVRLDGGTLGRYGIYPPGLPPDVGGYDKYGNFVLKHKPLFRNEYGYPVPAPYYNAGWLYLPPEDANQILFKTRSKATLTGLLRTYYLDDYNSVARFIQPSYFNPVTYKKYVVYLAIQKVIELWQLPEPEYPLLYTVSVPALPESEPEPENPAEIENADYDYDVTDYDEDFEPAFSVE